MIFIYFVRINPKIRATIPAMMSILVLSPFSQFILCVLLIGVLLFLRSELVSLGPKTVFILIYYYTVFYKFN